MLNISLYFYLIPEKKSLGLIFPGKLGREREDCRVTNSGNKAEWIFRLNKKSATKG